MKEDVWLFMPDTKIYLEFDDEIQQALADSRLSIEDILRYQAIEGEVTYGVVPYQVEEGAKSKEVVTIILAGSVAIAAIGFAISQVLNAYYGKPHFVEYYENEELRDKDDKILVDDEGKPIFKKVRKQEIVQPKKEEKRQFEANLDLKNGMVMKFSSDTKQ
jgi:hypothetical protein